MSTAMGATVAAAASGHQRGALPKPPGFAPTSRLAAARIASSIAAGGCSRLAARQVASSSGSISLMTCSLLAYRSLVIWLSLSFARSSLNFTQVGQIGSQFVYRVTQSALDRFDANAGQLRNLMERQSGFLLQEEGIALQWRQGRNGAFQALPKLAIFGARLRLQAAGGRA